MTVKSLLFVALLVPIGVYAAEDIPPSRPFSIDRLPIGTGATFRLSCKLMPKIALLSAKRSQKDAARWRNATATIIRRPQLLGT